MLPMITKVDPVINPNRIEFTRSFPKLDLILGELIKQRKGIKNKVANLTQYMALLAIPLLDVI